MQITNSTNEIDIFMQSATIKRIRESFSIAAEKVNFKILESSYLKFDMDKISKIQYLQSHNIVCKI